MYGVNIEASEKISKIRLARGFSKKAGLRKFFEKKKIFFIFFLTNFDDVFSPADPFFWNLRCRKWVQRCMRST